MLDTVIPIFDDETGEQIGETTVGEVAAATVEDSSGFISDAVSAVVGGATGNPAVGGLASLAALAGLGAGANRLRRRRQEAAVEEEPDEAPAPAAPKKARKKKASS